MTQTVFKVTMTEIMESSQIFFAILKGKFQSEFKEEDFSTNPMKYIGDDYTIENEEEESVPQEKYQELVSSSDYIWIKCTKFNPQNKDIELDVIGFRRK
ncbi:hypothetical protein DDB_G0268916 [Dictyostelium discoideum AX4]|uniref:Uncharacterized protein n=1 Tax=Dictyostelium discoideum TaxID=44689 RepID=Q55EG0_DICDI|nr:hypothetical protein DDB_G0268916 [Dictyostelium discoideum AX4]EAL73047.1 hypothetical protein DDB_G0268916 [Dictyostelium discoideum AX4]|eukprot:XP_647060.1 hypothetical protein DDB_G0268916 [Dictyostelium discoideum AX4]